MSSSNYNNFTDFNCSSNEYGIKLRFSDDNIFTNMHNYNNYGSDGYGINIIDSDDNIVRESEIYSNPVGIYLDGSSRNKNSRRKHVSKAKISIKEKRNSSKKNLSWIEDLIT